MRLTVLVGLALLAPTLAFADETVAGQWRANVGHAGQQPITIDMTVSPDGKWDSQTNQGNKPVAKMSGTYQQTTKSDTSGTLVFTPTQGHAQQGEPKVERDTYRITNDGRTLRLTSMGDTMVFHKQ